MFSEYTIPNFAAPKFKSYHDLYVKSKSLLLKTVGAYIHFCYLIENLSDSFNNISVLHKYGFLLGYWQSSLKHYGGLFHAQVWIDNLNLKKIGCSISRFSSNQLQCHIPTCQCKIFTYCLHWNSHTCWEHIFWLNVSFVLEWNIFEFKV